MFLHSGMFQTTVQDVVLSWISVNTTGSSLACLQRTMSFGSNMAELQWAVFGAVVKYMFALASLLKVHGTLMMGILANTFSVFASC